MADSGMKTIMIIWEVLGVIVLAFILLLWAVMSPSSPSGFLQYGARYKPALQTTISADGQMVAVIQERPPGQDLFVRHLIRDSEWRKVPLPHFQAPD